MTGAGRESARRIRNRILRHAPILTRFGRPWASDPAPLARRRIRLRSDVGSFWFA